MVSLSKLNEDLQKRRDLSDAMGELRLIQGSIKGSFFFVMLSWILLVYTLCLSLLALICKGIAGYMLLFYVALPIFGGLIALLCLYLSLRKANKKSMEIAKKYFDEIHN